MIYEFSNYSEYLKYLLEERKKLNPSYSLRAMAKNLGISATTLSDVINERKNLSDEAALKVAKKLQLTGRREKYFLTLVHYKTAKNADLKALLVSQLRALNPLQREHFNFDLNQFKLIADWYHAAILEMTYLKKLRMSSETIAKQLGITQEEAQEALELLKKLGFIETLPDGLMRKTQKQIKFQSDTMNLALRKFHQQMFNKTQEALLTHPIKERFIGTETFPLNRKDYEEACDIIELCFQQILELSKKSEGKNHVYHIGIQLFKMTQGLES